MRRVPAKIAFVLTALSVLALVAIHEQPLWTPFGSPTVQGPPWRGFPAMVADISRESSVCDPDKLLNVLVDSAVYGRGDPDLFRPLKTDVSCSDHGVAMQSSLLEASGLELRRSEIPVLYLGDTRLGIETAELWGIEGVVSQSTSGFNQSLSDSALWRAWTRGHGFAYVHAARPDGGGHCESVPLVAAPRASNRLVDVWDTPCLELLVHYSTLHETDSAATARFAGMILHLLAVHPDWNTFDARAALRQVARRHPKLVDNCPAKNPVFYDPANPDRWNSCQGYGVVEDRAGRDAAARLNLWELDIQPPSGVRAVLDAENGWVDLEWYDFAQTAFERTVVVQFDTPPDYATPYTEGRLLYSGAPGRGWVRVRLEKSGVYHFGFYSIGKNGKVSPLEAYARPSVTYVEKPPARSTPSEPVTPEDRFRRNLR